MYIRWFLGAPPKNSQTGPDWPDSGQTPAQPGHTGPTDPPDRPARLDWPDRARFIELAGSNN